MNAIIYGRTTRPAKDSPDGETPTAILVTKEANGFAVFLQSYEEGSKMLRYWYGEGPSIRADAIEYGVKLATGGGKSNDGN